MLELWKWFYTTRYKDWSVERHQIEILDLWYQGYMSMINCRNIQSLIENFLYKEDNNISNNMPMLSKEASMHTIRVRFLLWVHMLSSIQHFFRLKSILKDLISSFVIVLLIITSSIYDSCAWELKIYAK